MTSIELKHQVRLQEWASVIKECLSSELSVRKWYRQQVITPTPYSRWEREVLFVAGRMAQQEEGDSVTFAEVPVPKKECRNETERSATLYVENVRIEIHPSCGREQLKTFAEIFHTC